MSDWLTHTMIGWITGKVLKREVGLVVVGSLIPDLVKLNDIAVNFGTYLQDFFNPFHTPVGSLLIGAILAMFFADTKKAFVAFCIGISTHFVLDFFLIGATRGIQLLFPFSWNYWRFNEIMGDYRITIFAVVAAVLFYIYYRYRISRNAKNKTGV